MKEWLLTHMRELKLKQVPLDSALDNGKRISSVLSIIMCFHHLIPNHFKMSAFKGKDIADMLSMLILHPNVEKKKCLDYDHVSKTIKPEMKKTLTDAIVSFCNQLHHSTGLSQLQWLYAVPLLHFLQGVSQPFGKPELDPQNIQWSDPYLGLNTLRQRVYNGDAK